MGTVDVDLAPANDPAIYPVESPARIGDADGQPIFASGPGSGREIACEGQLLHDRVANQMFVQIHFGAHARPANAQQNALAAQRRGNLNITPPPRHSPVGAILWDWVVGCIAVFVRSVGTRPKVFPEDLFDGARQRDDGGIGLAETRIQRAPSPGRRIHG